MFGQLRFDDGRWLGLTTIHLGTFFEGAELGWHPAAALRIIG